MNLKDKIKDAMLEIRLEERKKQKEKDANAIRLCAYALAFFVCMYLAGFGLATLATPDAPFWLRALGAIPYSGILGLCVAIYVAVVEMAVS